MEFEIEIETTKELEGSSIVETRGHRKGIIIRTAPGDLTGLMKRLENEGGKFGFPARDLLKRTKLVRLRAPEMVADILANREGARVGLVVSKGHDKSAYFGGKGRNPVLDSIVGREMIVGIEEEISDHGEQVLKPHEEEIKEKLRHLLELGSGIIAISLNNATRNSANERYVREIIESDYPSHYLGAVPILIASDFSSEHDNFLRTTVCLLNAYLWFKVDESLRSYEGLLRRHGYNHGLLVTQADAEEVPIPNVTPLKIYAIDPVGFVRSAYGEPG